MDDLLTELGALALGSRLKRLADSLMQDGVRIYETVGSEFEPRWFPVFTYLYRRGPTSITELARGLGVSHPGINKIANELIEARLVSPYRDRNDKRKRVLALTSLGREKYMQLEPVWRDIRQALQSLVDDGGGDFIRALTGIETSLNDCSFHDRFLNHRSRQYQDVEIRDYDASLAAVFSELNRKWIEHYFAMEEADARVLDDPDGQIIAKGGQILFALERTTGEVLGTCALLHVDQQRCELAKMAVDDAAKGRRLGIRLGQAILDAARSQGYETIFLESNRKLTPAISLYKKLGFIEQPFPSETEYSRADIYMELDLAASAAA